MILHKKYFFHSGSQKTIFLNCFSFDSINSGINKITVFKIMLVLYQNIFWLPISVIFKNVKIETDMNF